MWAQRILLALAAVAAVALVLLLPRVFEGTDETRVPPVQLRPGASTEVQQRPAEPANGERRNSPSPSATATPQTAEPPPATEPAPLEQDDDGTDGEDGGDD